MLNALLAHRDLLIEKLRARLDKQLRDRFGSSAEGIEQLQLMLEDLERREAALRDQYDSPGRSLDRRGVKIDSVKKRVTAFRW